MDIFTAQFCTSTQPFHEMLVPSASHPGDIHRVTRPLPGDEREEWTCTCTGWTYRGRCSHLAKVTPCDWDELTGPAQSEDQKRNHVCPRCQAPTYDELVAKDD